MSPRYHLSLDPRVGASDTLAERKLRSPAGRIDLLVTEIPRLYSNRSAHVADLHTFLGHFRDSVDQLLDRNVFWQPDIRRSLQGGIDQFSDPVHHVIDVGVGSNRGAVTPHLDGAAILDVGNFSTDRCRRFLSPPSPSAFRTVAVLKPGDPNSHVVASTK